MDPAIEAALVGVAGTIGGAAIPLIGQPLLEVLRLGRVSMVNLTGKWNASWYVDEAGIEKLYAADCIEITSHRGVRFSGRGTDLRSGYVIRGRVNSHGIVTFSYDSQERNYALVGGGVLLPDAMATQLKGRWHGYVREEKLVSGRVVWGSEKSHSGPPHQLYHAAVGGGADLPPSVPLTRKNGFPDS